LIGIGQPGLAQQRTPVRVDRRGVALQRDRRQRRFAAETADAFLPTFE
jgi:hypothetical protein